LGKAQRKWDDGQQMGTQEKEREGDKVVKKLVEGPECQIRERDKQGLCLF